MEKEIQKNEDIQIAPVKIENEGINNTTECVNKIESNKNEQFNK